MKNTFGCSISITLFGESHGEKIGCVLDGLAPGIKIDYENIEKRLSMRRPEGKISTKRREPDKFSVVSGAFNGYTTGTPLTILIDNTDTRSTDYDKFLDTPRPSHADYTAMLKYHGYADHRGGGHFSGRLTAPIVAAGALLESALSDKGIALGTHISNLHGISDRPFGDIASDIRLLNSKNFPALSADEEMLSEIESAATAGDSVGGVLESAVIGIPGGVGEPFFDSMESVISHMLFSVPGVKGVEFGDGFKLADLFGSEANDPFTVDDGVIKTKTNRNGGINGGITNGMPLIVRCAVKPTPSVFKEQTSISISKSAETTIRISGRHDPAIIHRARVVVDMALAIAISDMLTAHFGTDYLSSNK